MTTNKTQWRIQGRGPARSLFWVKKEQMTAGEKAGRASKTTTPPPFLPPPPNPLSSKSGSATCAEAETASRARKNVENSKDSFEQLNIDVPSLEGTQKMNSPKIKVISDLSLLFHEINLQYVVVGRQKAEFT